MDGKKNQNETGIDCGGVCGKCIIEPVLEDIRVSEVVSIPGGKDGIYDFSGKVSNPNNDHGASSFTYTFLAKDASGETIFEENGTSFILPKETKYVVEIAMNLPSKPSVVELVIADIQWEKFVEYKEKPNISVYNRVFNRTTSSVEFAEVKGLVANNSEFDFTDVDIVIVLRDDREEIVALHKTDMQTLPSMQQRDFRLIWPDPFVGEVQKIEVQVDTNVYRSDTFIRQYMPNPTELFHRIR